MPEFLTVKQAAQRIGRSPSAVRRIIYPIVEGDQHPDRAHIEPSAEEVQRLRMKGEIFAWRISDELLDRRAPRRSAPEPGGEKQPAGGGEDPALRDVVAVLRDQLLLSQQQLKVKDEQIGLQMEITRSLNERLREGNIIINSLQRQLSLASGQPTAEATEVADVTPNPASTPATASQKATKAAVKKAAKKGFLARMFR